jgi:GT2 family glycosyltransferase
VNWGCTTHEEVQQNGEGWVCKLVSPPSLANQLYAFGYRSHQAVVMKGNFIAQLGGFNEHYKIAADWDLIARAINLSKPKVWTYSLARFELGGESSKRLLEAHLELKMIRDKYLVRSLKYRILDYLWCATYLQYFGYKNYFTPIIIFFRQKMRRKKKKLNDRHIQDKFRRIHLNFGILSIYIVKRIEIQNLFNGGRLIRRLKSSFNINYIFWLHNKLHIEPYSALPPAHRVRK